MNHQDASHQLPGLLEQSLDDSTRADIFAHVDRCEDCKAWLQTADLIQKAFREESVVSHPSSELLAQYSVSPEQLAPAEARMCETHLRSCPSCQRESEITRSAISVDARHRSLRNNSRPSVAIVAASRLWLALAATFVVTVLTIILTRDPLAPGASDRALRGQVIAGSQLVESEGSITAESVTLESGADVRFNATKSVVFGDGFAVHTGASLTVEIVRPDGPPDA